MRVACVQMTSGADKARNLQAAERGVARAAAAGAELVVLPEKWNALGSADVLRGAAESLDDGESIVALRDWARRHGLAIVGGSITERRGGHDKLSNTSVAVDAKGDLLAVYRKIHLFDVEVGGLVYHESEVEEPGGEAVVAAVGDWPVGLTVCYDLRFPELFRVLADGGARLVTLPANFTLHTGRDHWGVLLRARAIESQFYVAAAAQVGEPVPGRPSYGRSLIVDPWGVVLAQAPDEETVVVADVDLGRLEDIRRRLPSLEHRRPEAYRLAVPA